METPPVRIAVIGTGYIAHTYHIPALLGLPEARVVALGYHSQRDRAIDLARDIGLAPHDCHADPYEAIGRDDVDAVLVLTPNDTHLPLARAAAAAGKHALVQKPLAPTPADCERIIEAARDAGVVLAASLMHRYFPEVREARRHIDSGAIGAIQSIRIRNAVKASNWAEWLHSRERAGGGAAIDVGVHGIDLVRHWTGAEITTAQARAATLAPERELNDESGPRRVQATNEDFAVAIYELSSGGIGIHEISWNEHAPPRRFEAEVRGSAGAVLVRSGHSAPLAISSPVLEASGSWLLPFLPHESPGISQHQAFIDAVRRGRTNETPGDDGLAAVRVADAMQRSFVSGQREKVVPSPLRR